MRQMLITYQYDDEDGEEVTVSNKFPYRTKKDLRELIQQHKVTLFANTSIENVWKCKSPTYVGYTPEGFTVTVDYRFEG